MLTEHGWRTDDGLTIDRVASGDLVGSLVANQRLKYELYDRALIPVSVENAIESDEHVFVLPRSKAVFVLLFYPDEYVGIIEIRELYVTLERLAGLREDRRNPEMGSQVINLLSRALSDDN